MKLNKINQIMYVRIYPSHCDVIHLCEDQKKVCSNKRHYCRLDSKFNNTKKSVILFADSINTTTKNKKIGIFVVVVWSCLQYIVYQFTVPLIYLNSHPKGKIL